MKAKSLIRYKIGYDPNKKQKSKSVKVEKMEQLKSLSSLSNQTRKDFEFMDLTTALNEARLEIFHNFGQYCSEVVKAAWENELAQKFCTNALHTNPVFNRALIGTWAQFYGKTNFRYQALIR